MGSLVGRKWIMQIGFARFQGIIRENETYWMKKYVSCVNSPGFLEIPGYSLHYEWYTPILIILKGKIQHLWVKQIGKKKVTPIL